MNDQLYKADDGKADPTLLEVGCVHALEAVQATLDYGAQKYEPNSWKNVDPHRYNKGARRHKRDRDKGELRDNESGLFHMAHEAINILFQLELFILANPDLDYTTFKAPPLDHKKGAK